MTTYRWKILAYTLTTLILTVLAFHYLADTEWTDAILMSTFICVMGFLGGILTGGKNAR